MWCERALLPTGIADDVVISMDEGHIVDIAVGKAAPLDSALHRGLTIPGFANAHSHAFHRALRGRTHRGAGDFWTWRDEMYRLAARLTPENYLALARATFAEMVMAGYTVVGEFHYVHHQPDGTPYAEPNAMGTALVSAAREAGIRLTLLDACYLRGGARKPLGADQLRFSDGTAAAWADRVGQLRETDTMRVGAAVHSVRAVDLPAISTVAKFAADRGAVLHAHVSEQMEENAQSQAEYGRSPTEVLADAGALSDRFTAVHATRVRPADIELLARARCTCCFCPTTERDLADGTGPAKTLTNAGVALAVGSDQHAVIDPFAELRGVEMNERMQSLTRGNYSAETLLSFGSSNGYRSLGWSEANAIEVGALADLITISLGGVRLSGAADDALIDSVVFAATSADVTDVVVNGRIIVRDGDHLTLDVGAELRSSILALAE
jgi:formiminoglutamate deiminase